MLEVALRVLRPRRALPAADLAGRRVVVSAGGTREPLDPVRFLGNWSSGLQGYALATTAAARGAEVTLVAANVALPDPAGVKVVRVATALQLREAMVSAAQGADAVVMAAAVADFRPGRYGTHQRSRRPGPGRSRIAAHGEPATCCASCRLSAGRPGQVVVGFAAETEDLLGHGRAKLAAQGLRSAGGQRGRRAGWRSGPATTRPSCWPPTAA